MKDEKLKFINDYMLHLLMNINSFALAGRHLHTIILTQGIALRTQGIALRTQGIALRTQGVALG